MECIEPRTKRFIYQKKLHESHQHGDGGPKRDKNEAIKKEPYERLPFSYIKSYILNVS